MNSNSFSTNQVSYLEITAEQVGRRIDNFLHTYFKNVPRSHLYRVLRTGEIRVNKGRVKPTYRLQLGDQLRLPPIHAADDKTLIKPQSQALHSLTQSILYEDRYLLIIDKPAGMAVHGGSGIHFGVIEALRALYPQTTYLELVHRLDRDTSGCLMIAKKPSMLRALHEALRRGEIQKRYFALVRGHWPLAITQVKAPLHKYVLASGERRVHVSSHGKPSLSQINIKQCFKIATLLDIQPFTGRTHQIRVHTAFSGHPIAGDDKYGHEAFNQQMRGYSLTRLFLHAQQLDIHLPEKNYQLTVSAPLPLTLVQVLQQLASTPGS